MKSIRSFTLSWSKLYPKNKVLMIGKGNLNQKARKRCIERLNLQIHEFLIAPFALGYDFGLTEKLLNGGGWFV